MSGWIEVVAGSMYSGKTEELIRRVRRAQYAKLQVQVFKPIIDIRYHENDVTSHNQNRVVATPLRTIHEVWNYLEDDTKVVAFDEGQFFTISKGALKTNYAHTTPLPLAPSSIFETPVLSTHQ